MAFEDYNYDLYNQHILIDPNLSESDEELKDSNFKPIKKHESNENRVKPARLQAPNLRGFEEPHYQELLSL